MFVCTPNAATADLVVEGEYFFEGTTHTPIEPHCAIGWYAPDGKLTVWSSTQVPHYLHRELARVFDLDVARIRVVQPAVGGAFGGKSEPFDLEFCVALLAMRTGRPVKILYATQVSVHPPTFVLWCNLPEEIPESYLRYIHNGFRDRWGFMGSPLRINLRRRREAALKRLLATPPKPHKPTRARKPKNSLEERQGEPGSEN